MAYGKIKADTFVYDNSGSDVEVTLSSLGNKAGLASPTFTGTPAAPTAAANTNTTQIATTAYVQTELGDYATLAAPALTGTATGVNLTLSGNLTVNGTTTTVATTNTTITDNLIELNSGASSNANDSGILIERGSTGDNAIIAWDESNDKFVVGTTTGTASSTGNITIATGTLIANVEGTATQVIGVSNGSNTGYRVPFLSADSGAATVYTDLSSGMTYNPSTNLLYVAGSFEDSKGNVRNIPQLSKSAQHTLVAADSGKHIFSSTGGWILNASTDFPIGDAVTLINNSGSDQTLTVTGATCYNAADAATGNRILAARGMATLICVAADTYHISGAGLS